LRQLPDYGRVLAQNLNSVDVTKRVADLRLRIANALATRERLTQLLQRATVIEDILKIEAELRRLTEEIETMQAELKGLVDQIAYSTLTVSFVPNAPEASAFMQRRYSRFGWINAIGFEGFDNGF
jgi:seryl-tRNA synthetase